MAMSMNLSVQHIDLTLRETGVLAVTVMVKKCECKGFFLCVSGHGDGVCERSLLHHYSVLGQFLWQRVHVGSSFASHAVVTCMVPLDYRPHCGHLAYPASGTSLIFILFSAGKWTSSNIVIVFGPDVFLGFSAGVVGACVWGEGGDNR